MDPRQHRESGAQAGHRPRPSRSHPRRSHPRAHSRPRLRTAGAELRHPGTGFFEGPAAPEGRGTDDPFTLIGASWVTDNAAIAAELDSLHLPGVAFEATTRTIDAGYKFGGQTIPMIKIHVTKRDAVHPVELGVHILRAIYARHRTEFTWRPGQIDR